MPKAFQKTAWRIPKISKKLSKGQRLDHHGQKIHKRGAGKSSQESVEGIPNGIDEEILKVFAEKKLRKMVKNDE